MIAKTSFTLLAAALLAASVCGSGRAGERYAFLVGVGKYATSDLQSLQFAEGDITSLAETLQQAGFQQKNVVVMTHATGAQTPRFVPIAKDISREFLLLISELDSDDTLLVAFSGHGVQLKGVTQQFFCPSDADLSDRTTLISIPAILQVLEHNCRARSSLLLVDACRDDPLTSLARSSRTVLLQAVTTLPPAPKGGVVAMFSCSEGQQAFEHPTLGHGVFFHYVIDALQGAADYDKDRDVSLPELEQHVVKNVQQFTRTTLGKRQTPERRGQSNGLVSIAQLGAPRREPLATAKPASAAHVEPNPTTLVDHRGQNGKSFWFDVTGETTGRVWGSDIYTDDSHLATAAVHAGVLRDGERGHVQVTIGPAREAFQGSLRNGVTSIKYSAFDGSFTFGASRSLGFVR